MGDSGLGESRDSFLLVLGTVIPQVFSEGFNLLPALGGKFIGSVKLSLTDECAVESAIELGLNLAAGAL